MAAVVVVATAAVGKVAVNAVDLPVAAAVARGATRKVVAAIVHVATAAVNAVAATAAAIVTVVTVVAIGIASAVSTAHRKSTSTS